MSGLERDEVVAAALRALPVPPHREGFWSELEAAVAGEVGAGAGAGAGAGGSGSLADRLAAAGAARSATAEDRPGTGELPAVAPLEARRRPSRAPFLVAAAVLVLLGAVGIVTLGGDGDDDDTELADQPAATTAATTAASTFEADGTTAPQGGDPIPATSAPVGDDGSPEGVVVTWLEAIGEGDPTAAAALVGPRTAAFIEAQGGTVEGFMRDSGEGYGALAGAEDRAVTLLPGGPLPYEGGELQIVVVTGTHPGEGEPEARVEVIPVVDAGEGFRVEHLAFDPSRDNDPVFTLPAETETGLGDFAPDDEINVFVPADGIVYFQLDGGEVGTDETSEVAGDPFALYDPPGDLRPGEHLLVLVAVGADGTIAHFGGTFTVR